MNAQTIATLVSLLGVVVGIAPDHDVVSRAAHDRGDSLIADEDASAAAAVDGVGAGAADQDIAQRVAGERVAPWPPRTFGTLVTPPPAPVAVPVARLTVTGVVYAA